MNYGGDNILAESLWKKAKYVRKLYTLADIMREFNTYGLFELTESLKDIACACESLRDHGVEVDKDFRHRAVGAVSEAYALAKEQGLPNTFEVSQYAENELRDEWACDSFSAIRAQALRVVDALRTDLSEITFLSVAPGASLDDASLLGAGVAAAFPSARQDIIEAGNCLAAECHTAAVFHLMRAIEVGLRALCNHFGMKTVKRVRRGGKVTRIPVSYTDWETMLNQLQPKIDAKMEKMKRGPKKQASQEFYYPLLQDLRGFRDAWRNHTMHSRAFYAPKDAEAVLDHVRRFMGLLATKITEGKNDKVVPIRKV